MRRGLWCEFLSFRELGSPRVIALLRARGLGVMAAVTPGRLAEAPRLVRTLHDAGLRVGLWPMLSREQGRWPNVHNAESFVALCRTLLECCEHEPPDDLAVDLEPPLHQMRALVALELAVVGGMIQRGGMRRAAARLSELCEHLAPRGIRTVAAVVPLVLADRAGPAEGWQRFLGTPVEGVAFESVSPMLYTSLFEGYARGVLGRGDVRALLAAGARRTRQRFGARASVSLGAVGPGVLGDEPTYRAPAELADDVAIARAAGIEELLVYSLDGILARPPAEAWLDALVATPAATRAPPATPRALALLAGLTAASRVMRGGRALRRALRPR